VCVGTYVTVAMTVRPMSIIAVVPTARFARRASAPATTGPSVRGGMRCVSRVAAVEARRAAVSPSAAMTRMGTPRPAVLPWPR